MIAFKGQWLKSLDIYKWDKNQAVDQERARIIDEVMKKNRSPRLSDTRVGQSGFLNERMRVT